MLHNWAIKGIFGHCHVMSSYGNVSGHIKEALVSPVKSRALCPGSGFPQRHLMTIISLLKQNRIRLFTMNMGLDVGLLRCWLLACWQPTANQKQCVHDNNCHSIPISNTCMITYSWYRVGGRGGRANLRDPKLTSNSRKSFVYFFSNPIFQKITYNTHSTHWSRATEITCQSQVCTVILVDVCFIFYWYRSQSSQPN